MLSASEASLAPKRVVILNEAKRNEESLSFVAALKGILRSAQNDSVGCQGLLPRLRRVAMTAKRAGDCFASLRFARNDNVGCLGLISLFLARNGIVVCTIVCQHAVKIGNGLF